MKIPRRKWVVTLHMRNGDRHRIVCRGFKHTENGDPLTSIRAIGGKLPLYIRLDAIDMIRGRRAWLKWGWS